MLLDESGFTRIRSGVKVPASGVEVSFTAADAAGQGVELSSPGSFSSGRTGLRRADVLWRSLGKAAVLHARSPRGPSCCSRLTCRRAAVPARSRWTSSKGRDCLYQMSSSYLIRRRSIASRPTPQAATGFRSLGPRWAYRPSAAKPGRRQRRITVVKGPGKEFVFTVLSLIVLPGVTSMAAPSPPGALSAEGQPTPENTDGAPKGATGGAAQAADLGTALLE